MLKLFVKREPVVKVYHGYGHTHDLVVYGHIFKKKALAQTHFTSNIFYNTFYMLRLFLVLPFAKARVRLHWQQQQLENISEEDGFFRFEWVAGYEINAGWHNITIALLNEQGKTVTAGEGKIYVPHKTQYGFISDIDDTVMISHSATIGRRLIELFVHNPRTRSVFTGVAEHYELLSLAHTSPELPNPFFYVSSSEWNLYDYLNEFFNYHGLPQGTFLLNQVKRWFQLLNTGKTKHEGKLIRVMRILHTFPKQKFVLLGDNTQQDPAIYASIAKKFPGRIYAIYIRNIVEQNETSTKEILDSLLNNNVYTCLFKESNEAIDHSRHIGLIE